MSGDHSGRTTSVWMDTASRPEPDPLQGSAQADVCIIGAGIGGLTTAYQLLREGRSVIVLDDGPIAGGETERTTAHLSSALDDNFPNLERWFGADGTRLAVESHRSAIDRIETIAREEGIDCDFQRVDEYFFLAPGQDRKTLEDEYDAAVRCGHGGAELVDRVPWEFFNTGAAIRFPNQAQFHALRYLAGLAEAVMRMGGRIHPRTHALLIEDGRWLETNHGHRVEAEAFVVATNTPYVDRVTMHTKQAAYRTYVIGALVPRGSVPMGLYSDMLDPYHYVRLQTVDSGGGAHDVLIVGGEDHKTGQANDAAARFARLEAWTRERFPMVERVEHHWSGQVMEPVDGLAFLGRNPGDADNVYIITGDSGHGLTHGTIGGMLIADLIQGRPNAWAKIYDPSRKPITRGVAEFVKENANVVMQYTDHLSPGDVASVHEIARGEGAIMRDGARPVAVHRDDAGRLHRRSAVCPHMGCVLRWNSLERSWDCPCHGSRFDAEGGVVNGPALDDLKHAGDDEP